MIDTHAHLLHCNRPLDELLQNAQSAGIEYIINVGLNVEDSLRGMVMSQQHSIIIPTIGIHPCESKTALDLEKICELAQKYPFKAIGEIGLDYFRNYAPKKQQIQIFHKQIEIAQRLNLPIIIHNRHADEDMIEILKDYKDIPKVFHCFSSDIPFVDKVIDWNSMFSFTGMITYSKKGKVINALKHIPLEKLMLETDSPYLSPQSKKGVENQPSHLKEIAEKLAAIKNISLDKVCSETTKNALKFFKLNGL